MYRSRVSRTNDIRSPERGGFREVRGGSGSTRGLRRAVDAGAPAATNASSATEGPFMGVMDWMNGEEEGDESDEFDAQMDDADEFDDGGDAADDGGLDDEFGETDEFGGDLDDEFGEADEFGDDFDDGFGGDAGGNVAELEDRIGELENEVSSLSSNMNTIRQENIQIGETVDELDDTIRKLLDIYEMVTRGINPFVDDAREMGGIDGGNGAFGLFDAEEEEEGENLDNDVATAEADSFFDDDLGELDAEAGEQEAEIAAEDELSEEERDAAPGLGDASEDGEDAEDEAADDGGGASFDDLKAEYEDGEWDAEEDAEADAEMADEAEGFDGAMETVGEEETFEDADEATLDEAESVDAEAESVDVEEESVDAEEESASVEAETFADEAESEGEASAAADADGASPAADRAADDAAAESANGAVEGAGAAGDGDAYLDALPPSFVAETLLLEWAEYLVDEGGSRNAVRAVRQYREFGWISARAADDFEEYVVGAADAGSPARGDALTVDHHTTSLSYIVRLAGDSPEVGVAEETVALGGEGSGIRS